MELINNEISLATLKALAEESFGDMVKAVVDVERKIMVIGGELHSDEESMLIADGSLQKNLWGINIYPEIAGNDKIEFDSMINLKPTMGNKTRGVDAVEIRKKIIEIVNKLIKE